MTPIPHEVDAYLRANPWAMTLPPDLERLLDRVRAANTAEKRRLDLEAVDGQSLVGEQRDKKAAYKRI